MSNCTYPDCGCPGTWDCDPPKRPSKPKEQPNAAGQVPELPTSQRPGETTGVPTPAAPYEKLESETPRCDALERDKLDSNDIRAWRALARTAEAEYRQASEMYELERAARDENVAGWMEKCRRLEAAQSATGERDLGKLSNDVAEIVAYGLHYFEHWDDVQSMKSAAEVRNAIEGGIARYHAEPLFAAKVKSMVAMLMRRFTADKGKAGK